MFVGRGELIQAWSTKTWQSLLAIRTPHAVWSLSKSAHGGSLAAGMQNGGVHIYECAVGAWLRLVRCLDVGTVNHVITKTKFVFATSSGDVYEYSHADATTTKLWTQPSPVLEVEDDSGVPRYDAYALLLVPLLMAEVWP